MGQVYKEQAAGEGFKAALDAAAARNDETRLRTACEGFESYFLQTMFREMRKTSLNAGGLFAKSGAEEIFEDMLDEERAKAAAKRGGIGLADMVCKQLSKQLNN